MKKVILYQAEKQVMEAHALHDFPYECCGFFFGESSGNTRRIRQILPVENAKIGDQRRRFEIKPSDYFLAEKYALESGFTLLGIYHSHPLHPAIPSEHDLVQAMPWFSYIILSTNENDVVKIRSWQLNDNRKFEEEQITINTNNYGNINNSHPTKKIHAG